MKRIIVLMISVLLLCALAGCGRSGSTGVTPKYSVGDSEVCIYYPDGKEVACDKELYQLKQPDSITASVEEIMGVISEKLADRIKYHTYMVDENNNLSLEFNVENGELTEDYALIFEAAVTKTLFQIAGLGNIEINTTFDETENVRTKRYNRSSFYFYGYDAEQELNASSVEVYYANPEGNGLLSKVVMCNPDACLSVEECIVNYLEETEAIPSGTKLKSLYINDGICYLELTNDFTDSIGNIKAEVVLYSVVNSIVSLDGISKAAISVEGSNTGLYRGSIDITMPLEFSDELTIY